MTRKTPAYMQPAGTARAAARKLNDGIRWELRHYPADKVAAFVRTVGVALGEAELFAQLQREPGRRRDLERLKKATENYLAELGRPVYAQALPRRIHGATADDDRTRARAEAFYRARQAANMAAADLLQHAEHALRDMKAQRRGRPGADDFGLLARIAARYLALFGERPTSTPGSAFVNVATLALENFHGQAPRDASRQVRAALKAL